MARKRFIKPEFFLDADLAEVSIEARFLYAGMWPWMDRQGVVDADPRLHRVNVFPHDETMSVKKVTALIDQLINAGFLIRFSYQGKDLLFCKTFTLHQKLFPDEKSKFNVPDTLLRILVSNAGVPALSMHSTVQVGDKEKDVFNNKKEDKKKFENEDFEKVYALYPKKVGKSRGFSRLKDQMTSDQLLADFTIATKNYAQECANNKTELKFIKHFCTWVGTKDHQPWKDYVAGIPTSQTQNVVKFAVPD